MPLKDLLEEFEEFARTASDAMALMQHVSQRIHMEGTRYNLVTFYLIDKKNSSTLVLGAYAGSITPTPRLSLTAGLTGIAASTGSVIVVDNVAEDSRYFQTSGMVKSQISVPIMVTRRPAGVLNVESYFLSAFKPAQEREFVEACANIVGKTLERIPAGDVFNV
jgi:putative methionine-R-sulfoxide reductase with GAF domain